MRDLAMFDLRVLNPEVGHAQGYALKTKIPFSALLLSSTDTRDEPGELGKGDRPR